MAKYQRFEDLPVWNDAAILYNEVLDLFERPNAPFSSAFRNQLERAALSISNNIAEGFERVTTKELISFIAIARGSAGEVRSMVAVMRRRPKMKIVMPELQRIEARAESCAKQLNGWMRSIEGLEFEGKRHLPSARKEAQRVERAAREFRLKFLHGLKPEHPLYQSAEARQARGEE